jgi:mono/diheme cytochrome c family protein
MRSYGTALNETQVRTLLDYLEKNFGPKGAAPAPAPAPAAGGDAAADAEGKAMVNGSCGGCHGVDLVTSKKATRAEWQAIVERMRSYGTTLTAQQTTTLVDYLTRTYGPAGAAPAPAPAAGDDAGKRLLEGYCASCHDLDLVSGRKGTQAEWQEIVDRMNGRGAGVPDADIPTMVQYLVKMYGAK